jgi:hypothetical protein
MKTMLLQKKLNNIFKLVLALFILVSASATLAETKWEVAVVFRGAENDEAFQKDIDDNILELARIAPSANLRLSIYRETLNGSYIFQPALAGAARYSLSDLLNRQDLKNIPVLGILKKFETENLNGFLKTFYKSKDSKKALIIYSHGKGADGLHQLSTKELKDSLVTSAPHLDLLWFDACFMANFEFLYELRNLSDYTLASEEAEFSSGLPFQTLASLPGFNSTKDAALSLAKNFVESYSYLLNGQQRNYVSVSSATISLTENAKLGNIAVGLKNASALLKTLDEKNKLELKNLLIKKASMDNKDLVDLGSFLIELRKKTKTADADLTKTIRLLNIESVKKLKTNPRLHIPVPANAEKMVFGYNNWMTGDEADLSNSDIFTTLIKNEGLIAGPNKSNWPYKKVQSNELLLSPFGPALNTFNYYFLSADGKLLSKALSASRTHDVVETTADSANTPLLYSAYTQQLGTRAERYTGYNIALPGSVPSMDYFELEFNQLAQWLSL